MDEVLRHFSHEHPLMLIDEAPKSEENFVCYGCQKPILGSAYSCSECNYFLHNKCAQLSKTIKHPLHSQHPLTLFIEPPYYKSSTIICSICKIGGWKWFTYHCSRCEFDIHIQCILDDDEEGVIEHECHDHPLILVQRSALFCCDACNVKDEDSSYRCTSICPFWIHKTCASLPNTIKHSDHDHPLVLAYSLPDKFRNFEYLCNICHHKMHPSYWVYHCADCRYFVHLKCAAKPKKEPLLLRGNIYCNGLFFSCESCKFYLDVNCATTSLPTTIKHEAHNHPLRLLSLSDSCLCNGCGSYIFSNSFGYGCEACVFYLHNYCARLPRTISHSWDHHPINLIYPPFGDHPDEFICEICEEEMHPNHWIYHCRPCDQSFHYECVRPFQKYSNFKFGGIFEITDHPHNVTFVGQSKNKSVAPCYSCGVRPHDIPVLECAPCNFVRCIRCM